MFSQQFVEQKITAPTSPAENYNLPKQGPANPLQISKSYDFSYNYVPKKTHCINFNKSSPLKAI